MNSLVWLGILFCVTQSAMFSGLNLAFFGVSRLRLEVEKSNGNQAAEKVLRFREDSNFLLVTILWGNVGINVLLTLLSSSVLAGVSSFLFSTIIITLAGEITPQAYFSRHALRMAALLSPVLRFYQYLLYPVTKPSALLLDLWLGKESIQYFREKDITEILRKHIDAEESDVDHLEGIGAMNFLAIDDVLVVEEGEDVNPDSIIKLVEENGELVFPVFKQIADDQFIQQVASSHKKWIVLTDPEGHPCYVLDSDKFLREALLNFPSFSPWACCHVPILAENKKLSLGDVILRMKNQPSSRTNDGALDRDVVLVWGERKKIITGADILGRLLRGVTAPADFC
ncbi:MAG: DUF21 domain-containing protein [Desulfuromusa sp.]|jgi:metal transporter CNNM|nr:DUF21 domain-containing protein [Desulfuromusa sp.]